MGEKRETPRFAISQMIGYYPNREEYVWAEGIDISMGGISCRSKEPIEVLTNVFVMVSVRTPDGERLVRCEGYVAHAEMVDGMCRFGIDLTRIFEEDRPSLAAYLASLSGDAGPGAGT